MPKRHLFTRFVRDFKEFTLPKLDFCHYTVPIQTDSDNGFKFPSEYIGQYGVYDAIEHVYSRSKTLKPLLKDDYLLTSTRYFATDLEKAIEGIRSEFRAENKINPSAYSIFVAPGNEVSEVEFSMDALRKGVKEFLLKYSYPTSLSAKALPLADNFVTILSLHKGSEGEAWVKNYLKENEWFGRLVLVSDEGHQHYDAMAASDFGLIYDGQMVSAANALHLPTNCLIKMRMHHQWWHDFYNRWWNDMNIIADNSINPELIGGQVWSGKICDTLAEAYLNPETRYNNIQKTDGFIQDALSFKPLDRSKVTTRDLILEDGQAYEQYFNPLKLSARILLKEMQAHQEQSLVSCS
jgi:hypothetical protein